MKHMPAARALFGGEVSAEIAALLERAMRSYTDTQVAETLLWQALGKAPDALPVHFSLYKFYFYKGDMEQAEQTARKALVAAARLGKFSADWMRLQPSSCDWSDHAGPAHFYLFSLKALAFIRLRQGDADESAAMLAKLSELDPMDTVGASVIRTIADGSGR